MSISRITSPGIAGYSSIQLVFTVFFGLVVFITWANIADLDQIARAQGQIIASSRTQIVQSANDGVIKSFEVAEGDAVTKGQILVKLEREKAEAAYHDSLSKVAALKARLIRLQSEVLEKELVFPAELQVYFEFVQNQTTLYQRRQQALNSEISSLREGLALLNQELDVTEPLLATGDIGQIEIIRLKKQIAEYKGRISKRQNQYFEDAQEEMAKTQEQLATEEQILTERRVVQERLEIRAPSTGRVKKFVITTPGAKVRPGDIIVELLPTDSNLIVETKLMPADVAVVREGLSAWVKLDAYDSSIYGSLKGEVRYISPDALTEKTAQGENIYYQVHVQLYDDAVEKQNKEHPDKPITILPGMTGLVEINTGTKTVWRYLTKPITKTLSESFTER